MSLARSLTSSSARQGFVLDCLSHESRQLKGATVEEIGKSLPVVFKRHLRRTEPQLAEILAPLWVRVAGKAIADHSRPVAFSSGALTLETTCATWAGQLQQMQAQIAEAVNAFLGAPVVKELRVRVVQNLPPVEENGRSTIFTPHSLETPIPELDSRAGLDPETTRILERSLAKYFARGRRRPD